jgi:hypothetical protein
MIIFGACSAQKSVQKEDAQSLDITQEIIGTWIEQDVSKWVFNDNGILTRTFNDGNKNEVKFGVTDTKLATFDYLGTEHIAIYEISMSSDGKTLIIFNSSANSSGTHYGWWLTKK